MSETSDQPCEPQWLRALRLARSAKRCGARTRRRGTPCESPAMRGKVWCRIHGGLSPGAPRGQRNGRYVTGYFSKEATEERRNLRKMLRQMRRALDEL